MSANLITTHRGQLHCDTTGCAAVFSHPLPVSDRLAFAEIRTAAATAGWRRTTAILGDGRPATGNLDNYDDQCPACAAGHGPVTADRFTALPPGEWYVVVELADKPTGDLPHVVNGAEIIASPDDAYALADDYNDRAEADTRPGENIPQYVPMQLVEVLAR